jgi:hypothetical protein
LVVEITVVLEGQPLTKIGTITLSIADFVINARSEIKRAFGYSFFEDTGDLNSNPLLNFKRYPRFHSQRIPH